MQEQLTCILVCSTQNPKLLFVPALHLGSPYHASQGTGPVVVDTLQPLPLMIHSMLWPTNTAGPNSQYADNACHTPAMKYLCFIYQKPLTMLGIRKHARS